MQTVMLKGVGWIRIAFLFDWKKINILGDYVNLWIIIISASAFSWLARQSMFLLIPFHDKTSGYLGGFSLKEHGQLPHNSSLSLFPTKTLYKTIISLIWSWYSFPSLKIMFNWSNEGLILKGDLFANKWEGNFREEGCDVVIGWCVIVFQAPRGHNLVRLDLCSFILWFNRKVR